MKKTEVALLIYTHTDCDFIFPALIGQINKHVKNMDIFFAYNENSPLDSIKNIPKNWKKITYDDKLIWTDRINNILKKIKNKYILFIHEDWLPISDVKSEIIENVKNFMESIDCGFMMSYSHVYFMEKNDLYQTPFGLNDHPLRGTSVYTGYEDYYYYPMGWHVFQPAIWKKSILEEFCQKLRKTKVQNEDPECLKFMGDKNCWSVQNSKTVRTIRTMNSLIFPHMHALSEGSWNFLKYPELKSLIEKYNINVSDRPIHQNWEIDTQ